MARASSITIVECLPGSEQLEAVLELADQVLAQRIHVLSPLPGAEESHVLGAFEGERCVGFLRYVVQVIGAKEGRPPVVTEGVALREGYVEALGVDPAARRRGIGASLQAEAQTRCGAAGCWQMRSRSPVSSTENYALKLDDGYVLQASTDNDSYYFLKKL